MHAASHPQDLHGCMPHLIPRICMDACRSSSPGFGASTISTAVLCGAEHRNNAAAPNSAPTQPTQALTSRRPRLTRGRTLGGFPCKSNKRPEQRLGEHRVRVRVQAPGPGFKLFALSRQAARNLRRLPSCAVAVAELREPERRRSGSVGWSHCRPGWLTGRLVAKPDGPFGPGHWPVARIRCESCHQGIPWVARMGGH
jgi:hypothetical protein